MDCQSSSRRTAYPAPTKSIGTARCMTWSELIFWRAIWKNSPRAFRPVPTCEGTSIGACWTTTSGTADTESVLVWCTSITLPGGASRKTVPSGMAKLRRPTAGPSDLQNKRAAVSPIQNEYCSHIQDTSYPPCKFFYNSTEILSRLKLNWSNK